jgi:hypothetical protein
MEEPKLQSVDPAALATASVAAIVSVMVAEGPFNVLSLAVGPTILLVLFAHDRDPSRSRGASLHVAAVTAFAGMLIAAYPMEMLFKICKGSPPQRCLVDCNQPLPVVGVICFDAREPDSFDSTVPPIALFAVWMVCLVVAFVIDRRRVRKHVTIDTNSEAAEQHQATAYATDSPSEAALLVEYQTAQESAQHHDTLVWSVTSVMWGGSLVLMGFVLAAPRTPESSTLVTIVGVLGVALTLCAWRFAWQFNALKRQKYLRCKQIEAQLHMQQHTNLRWPSGNQRILYGVLMLSFVAAWMLLIWQARLV